MEFVDMTWSQASHIVDNVVLQRIDMLACGVNTRSNHVINTHTGMLYVRFIAHAYIRKDIQHISKIMQLCKDKIKVISN